MDSSLSSLIVKYVTIVRSNAVGRIIEMLPSLAFHKSLWGKALQHECQSFFTGRREPLAPISEVAPDPLHVLEDVHIHNYSSVYVHTVVCRWIQGGTTMKAIVGFLGLISCRPASHFVPNRKPGSRKRRCRDPIVKNPFNLSSPSLPHSHIACCSLRKIFIWYIDAWLYMKIHLVFFRSNERNAL